MLKDIQSLNGKLAALNRFLSKGAKRSLPFFKVLKSYTDKKNIQWTQEAAAALQEMKKFVETLPTLIGDSNKETPKDFLIEAPPKDNRKEVGRKMDTKLEEMKPSCEWKIYTDGASGFDGSDSKESRKIRIKSPQYKLIRGILYKKSFYTPWLRCIAPPKTYDDHKARILLAVNAQRCARIIQDCEKCKEQSAVRKRAESGNRGQQMHGLY
ncbi:hypothetical protein Tco_0684399 [Tanacetum coccineum]